MPNMKNGRPQISITEYQDANDAGQGVCLACGGFRDAVEPDAEGYDCEICGVAQVFGLEVALILDEIDVTD